MIRVKLYVIHLKTWSDYGVFTPPPFTLLIDITLHVKATKLLSLTDGFLRLPNEDPESSL